MPTGRRRVYSSAATYGLFVAVIAGASSAFVFPPSSSPPSTLLSEMCNRSNMRSTSLRISLESPSVATAAIDIGSGPSSKVPLKEVTSFDETGEYHKRITDNTEALQYTLAHDEVDLERSLSPSETTVAIKADAANAGANNDLDYPHFINLLSAEDGQTIASKLFNFSLLAASFCYVFVSVFYIDEGMARGWTPVEIGMRIPLDTWASYENSLSEKPIVTKTIINVVIYLLGDWLSQTLFQKENILNFDAVRTLKNGFVGACFGPLVHEYYEFSDWMLPVEGITFGITNRVFKILMDQTIYLSVKCSIFILAVGILNGESFAGASQNVKSRIKPVMFTAWKFWPLVHCVTYGLIPARHRILWVNSVDLVWNAILASKARAGEEDDSMEP